MFGVSVFMIGKRVPIGAWTRSTDLQRHDEVAVFERSWRNGDTMLAKSVERADVKAIVNVRERIGGIVDVETAPYSRRWHWIGST